MNTTQQQTKKSEITAFSYGDILNQLNETAKTKILCREKLLNDRRITMKGKMGQILQEAIERNDNEYNLWDELYFTGKESWDRFCEKYEQ